MALVDFILTQHSQASLVDGETNDDDDAHCIPSGPVLPDVSVEETMVAELVAPSGDIFVFGNREAAFDPHGDIGDIILILDKSDDHIQGQGRQEHRVRVPQGHTFLNVLRQNLQDVFRTLGNTHWGDVMDARMLSEALDVGFCIFADRLQFNSTRCLVSLDGLRGDYAYFLAIWWDEPTHFRSLELQCQKG